MKDVNSRIQKLLLLKSSGELSPTQQAELQELLPDESDISGKVIEIEELMGKFRSTDEDTMLDPQMRADILVAASDKLSTLSVRHSRDHDRANIFTLWRPAIVSVISAAAAIFLFFLIIPLSTYVDRDQLQATEDGSWMLADELELDIQLLILNEDVTWAFLDYASLADMDKDIEDIADELIKLSEAGI